MTSNVPSPLRHTLAIIVRPSATWRAVAADRTPVTALAAGYVAPLVAIAPIATFLARRFIGVREAYVVYRASTEAAALDAALELVLALAGLALVTALVDSFAPLFGARRNLATSFRIATFASTPTWLAAAFVLLPAFGFVELLAVGDEVFLLYAGLAALLGLPRGRALLLAACALTGAVAIAVGAGEAFARVAGSGL